MWMQCIIFDNNCVWIINKISIFMCLTKTSWTQSTTTFAYTLRRELPTIYLFLLHQMRTLRIRTLIQYTASAQILITWKVWYFSFSNIWPCLSVFCRFKMVELVSWENINIFIVNIIWQIVCQHWVFLIPRNIRWCKSYQWHYD